MSDAEDVFACITPEITRFMFWDPPESFAAYKARREASLRPENRNGFSFVIRRRDSKECIGITDVTELDADAPELGIWLKETAHRRGYGGEAIRALATWAAKALNKQRFSYSVATENVPSRRIAESLGGKIIGTRTSVKYDSVVYEIPWSS